MFKKNKLWSNKNFSHIKFGLVICLVLLTPLTFFLMAFAWCDSIEFHITHSFKILNSPNFFHTALVFGAIGLVISLIVLFIFLIIDFYLDSMLSFWKKFVFIVSIVIYTTTFISFEIFSAIFINYYFSIELLLAIIFWPLIYILLIGVMLLNQRHSYKNRTDISIKEILVNDRIFENNESETTLF